MDPVPLIKPSLAILKTGLAAMRRKLGNRQADQLVSTVIAELLKESPNLNNAEANLLAAEATRAVPNPSLLRAKEMYKAVREFRARPAKKKAAAKKKKR